MAIDPGKLGALVEEQNANPFGNVPAKPEDDGGAGEDEESEESSDKSPKERGEELLNSMGEFGKDLRDNADILVEVANEIGDDLLSDTPGEETQDMVEDALGRMPDFLSAGIRDQVATKSPDDQYAIGVALTDDEGQGELLAGFFGCCQGGEAPEDAGENEDLDEEGGDEEYDEDAE